jgi:hypothetical protein
MELNRLLSTMVLIGAVSSAPFLSAQTAEKPAQAVAVQKFGPYEALVFDKAMLSSVKVDEKGDVYLLLQPDKIGEQLTMKISMEKGAAYRKWFNGEETWVALQNVPGGRGDRRRAAGRRTAALLRAGGGVCRPGEVDHQLQRTEEIRPVNRGNC